MDAGMEGISGNCPHFGGLRIVTGSEFRCPACGARLDLAGVERWARDAEAARDEAYFEIEGDEAFARIVREERQREVYRRRKVLYDIQNVPRMAAARPEMILVSYDAGGDTYECRIFYKEPRPVWGPESISVEASLDPILALRSHPDPNVRLASTKVEEFHALRGKLAEEDVPPPPRRVFYANEI